MNKICKLLLILLLFLFINVNVKALDSCQKHHQDELSFTIKSIDKEDYGVKEIVISNRSFFCDYELVGAKLEIYDSNDKLVDKWTSSEVPHRVVLVPGLYYLVEKEAPNGFDRLEKPISFTILEDGSTISPVIVRNIESLVEVPITAYTRSILLSIISLFLIFIGLYFFVKSIKLSFGKKYL